MSSPSRGKVAKLRDVAARAGVSLATASKALNGRAEVSDVTRRRVQEAADALAFTPNRVARSLGSERSGTVGLLTSDLEGRFVLPILMGAEDAFGVGKIDVFLCDARGDAIREQHHLTALLTRRVDGIIVVGRSTDPRSSLGSRVPVPVVYTYAPSPDPTDISLTPDNRQGGRLAIEHLLSCGRTRIGYVSGDRAYAAARDRVDGARQAMREAGIGLVGDVLYSEWSERWGRAAGAMLLERYPAIDAIACGSDQVARGVMDAVRDTGRTVPDDVAVIGYDNWEPLAIESRPALTTIDAELQELGRQSARRIFDALDGEPGPRGIEHLPVRLVIRSSTIRSR